MYRHAAIVLFILTAAGCSTRRPVLYPNDYYQRVGEAQAQLDIEICLERARQYGAGKGTGGETVQNVGVSAAAGGASGAAIGAVGGAILGNAGQAAAVGAATGATAGIIGGLFHSVSSRNPDPVFGAFVDRCLREKGYEPIGWK